MKATPTNTHSALNAVATQVHDALATNGHFSATPTARDGDGFHAGHEKPTDPAPGQWALVPGAKLPPRAFEVHDKERHRFHVMAQSVPLDREPMGEVQRIGGEIFDATFAAESAKFEQEIAVGHLEVERLNVEKARLQNDIDAARYALEDIPATTEEEQAAPRFPARFSAKWWAFVLCIVLFLVSSGAALVQIANLYLPAMQSWFFAGIAASPWVLAAVAVEIFLLLLLRAESPKVVLALRGGVAVLTLGIVLWLAGLFPLAAPVTLDDAISRNLLLPDRRLAVAGQLLAELGVSFLVLTGMLKLLTYERRTLPNENRRRISNHIAELNGEWARVNKELGAVLTELGKPDGNLREWKNSRAAFIEEGITIIHLRSGDAAVLAEMQRRRAEHQRLLANFTA